MTEKVQFIPSRLKSSVEGGYVAGARDIVDDTNGKSQETINAEVNLDISDIKGGSSDSIKTLKEAIDAEKSARIQADDTEKQARQSADNVINGQIEAEGRARQNKDDDLQEQVDVLRALYEALTESDIVVVDYTDWPLASGEPNKIYRVTNWDGTQLADAYTDYMYYNNQWVLMATYNNGIDEVPTEDSDNLAKSGGIYNAIKEIGYFEASPEFINVKIDENDQIIEAIRLDGTKVLGVGCQIGDAETTTMDNPEWALVYMIQDRVAFGIKKDGTVDWSAGVPQAIKDYIESKLQGFDDVTQVIDTVKEISDFLEGYVRGDKLSDLLDKKEDGEYQDLEEFRKVLIDANDKILEGIQQDGTKVIGGDLNVGGSASVREDIKVLGSMKVSGVSCKVIESPEYLAAWVDEEGKILETTREDGTKLLIAGAEIFGKTKMHGEIESDGSIETGIDNPEFIDVETDSEGRILSSRDNSGVKKEYVGFSTPKVSIGDHTIENIKDSEGRSEITTDVEGKIISYRDSDGVKHEEVGIETNHLGLSEQGMSDFQQALKDSGFNPGGTGDWSDTKSIEIPIPRCAMANITNDNGDAIWPTSKGVNLKYYLQFWDMQGNYFKKEIIFNAQGNSSMSFVKKNGAADFCNNNGWDDDDTFSIKFGDWVAQDSFHFKAYYTDYIKGSCVVAYQISEAVYKTRGVYADVPWKKALIDFSKIGTTTPAGLSKDGIKDVSLQIDNGARCMPDGFPCIFYLNGEFYGIYSWQLKKHRDNYHFDKANPSHIQLDGTLYQGYLWEGSIDWTQFEIRNPKNLVYATAHGGSYKYDADVAQDEIAGNSDGSSSYDTWEAGSYLVNKIVKHGSHYYINSIADNTAEPIYNKKNNGDDAPDFKNKTGCGWINCTNTIKVKEAIINLSKRVGEINTLNETDSVAAKELFDTYFDADNIIDYQLIGMAVNDPDGFGKNWQWITYDGIKWYVCQYDKDMSFGNHWTGMFTRPASSGWCSSSTALPTGLALRYYLNEHVARWKKLVELGIFTVDFFEKKINKWVARIGQNNFKNEWKKWPETPCNRDSLIDFENWDFIGDYAINPSTDIWDKETNYSSNQEVWFRCGDSTEYLKFKAKKSNIGKPCLTGLYTTYPTAMGYRDSVWRYFKFIEAQLEDQNNFINSLNV